MLVKGNLQTLSRVELHPQGSFLPLTTLFHEKSAFWLLKWIFKIQYKDSTTIKVPNTDFSNIQLAVLILIKNFNNLDKYKLCKNNQSHDSSYLCLWYKHKTDFLG